MSGSVFLRICRRFIACDFVESNAPLLVRCYRRFVFECSLWFT